MFHHHHHHNHYPHPGLCLFCLLYVYLLAHLFCPFLFLFFTPIQSGGPFLAEQEKKQDHKHPIYYQLGPTL